MYLVKRNLVISITNTQPAFTCSKWKHQKHQSKAPTIFKINNKETRTLIFAFEETTLIFTTISCKL